MNRHIRIPRRDGHILFEGSITIRYLRRPSFRIFCLDWGKILGQFRRLRGIWILGGQGFVVEVVETVGFPWVCCRGGCVWVRRRGKYHCRHFPTREKIERNWRFGRFP